jgi:O-antigen ligase
MPVAGFANDRIAGRAVTLCAGFLFACLVLGGGGSSAPLPELILEVLAALVFAGWLLTSDASARVPRRAWLIAALVAAIPAIQLIPLPASIWQALPGRDLARDALALIGRENTWRSWSLNPSRTLASLLSLGPPLAILIMDSALDRASRVALLTVICLFALLTLLLGALQLSTGGAGLLGFYGPTGQVLNGFQANRNSTADTLLIALIAGPALVVELARQDRFPLSRGYVLGAAGIGMTLCLVGIILTASRTGLILLPVALLGAVLVLRSWLNLSARQMLAGGASLVALFAAGAWMLWQNTAVGRLAGRFAFDNELRPELWRDSLFVIQQHFPFGTGMGGFVPSIIGAERLEVVRETMPVRAHNDYLELALEAGLFGMAVLSTIALILSAQARQRLREAGTGGGAMAIFALFTLILLALHSLVDYPYRSMTIACLGAACAGMFLQPRGDAVAPN